MDDLASSIAESNLLPLDVMPARGSPGRDLKQHAVDRSADHPLRRKNYRIVHEIALRQSRGLAITENMRQAMTHYCTLFGELGCPGAAPA